MRRAFIGILLSMLTATPFTASSESSSASSTTATSSTEPASSTTTDSSIDSTSDSSSRSSSTTTSSRRIASTSAVRILSSASAAPASSSTHASNTDKPLIQQNNDDDGASNNAHSESSAGKQAAIIGVPVAIGLVALLALGIFFFRWRRNKTHNTDAIAPQGPTHWLDGGGSGSGSGARDDPFADHHLHSGSISSMPYKNPVRFYGGASSRRPAVGSTHPMHDPFAPGPLTSPPLVDPFILAAAGDDEDAPEMRERDAADLPIVQVQRSNSGYSVHPNVPLEHVIDFDDEPSSPRRRSGQQPTQVPEHDDLSSSSPYLPSNDMRLTATTEAALDHTARRRISAAASSNYEPTLPDTPRLSTFTSAPSNLLSPEQQYHQQRHQSMTPTEGSDHQGLYAALSRESVYSSDQRHVL